MKKMFTVVCAAFLMMALAIPAFAATTTKEDILDEIKSGVTVGDKVKQIPDKYIDLAEKFLDANSLTEDQLSTALADLKDAKQVWASSGETEFKDIPADVQQQLINKASASAKKVGAKLTFDGKTIEIVDANGKTFSALAKSNPIKQTGADYTLLTVMSLTILAVLAGGIVVARKYRLAEDR